MRPHDTEPWAKPVASLVIVLSLILAALAAYLLYDRHMLSIPETLIIVLSLLVVVPPSVSVIRHRVNTSNQPQSSALHR